MWIYFNNFPKATQLGYFHEHPSLVTCESIQAVVWY